METHSFIARKKIKNINEIKNIDSRKRRVSFKTSKMSNQDRTDCHLKMFFVLRNMRIRKNSNCVDM